MIRYVVFDMFETLVTLHNNGRPYFKEEISRDAGIPLEDFKGPWRKSEKDRSCGKVTFEKTISDIMHQFGVYDEEKYSMIVEKRYRSKETSFTTIDPRILQMLEELKECGCKIGLISNCFNEESVYIHKSELFPYFDVPLLSFEVGLAKPDPAIFRMAMEKLWEGEGAIDSAEFLYIGDGGSQELQTATSVGMQTGQALWFLIDPDTQPAWRMEEFRGFELPQAVVDFVKNSR